MPVRLPPAPYPPGYADVAPGYNIPGVNIPNVLDRDSRMRYGRYEQPSAAEVATELRRHRMDLERSRRRSEMTERRRRDVIRQEVVAARGMAPLDWEMDEL